jgi:F-type H+-transporting ATPase subunit c
MKKVMFVLLALLVVTMVAPVALAQGTDQAVGGGGAKGLASIAVGLGMGVAAFGCGLGQGKIGAAACEGIARNPGAGGGVRAAMILSLVFVETLVLFTLAMIALKVTP